MTDLSSCGYQSCESIGFGSAGEVFRCLAADGFPKSLKRLNSIAIDRPFLDRNCRRASRAPDHPGVVSIRDHQLSQAPYFIASEWFDAVSTLWDAEVPLAEGDAWFWICEMAEAMSHLHKFGAVHANLHPGNVYVVKERGEHRLKIADYGPGLVGQVHHIDIGETAVFAPPEQLETPEWHEDGAAQLWDVYRFGVLAFWLLNGEFPRGREYLEERHRQIANSGGRPVAFDNCALAAAMRANPAYQWRQPTGERAYQLRRDIIDQCLSLDPAGRPVDMREVRDAFRALESQFALEDARARIELERRRQARKLTVSRAVAACLAVSLATASFFLVQYLQRTHFFQERVSELDHVVSSQKQQIEEFDRRWSNTLHDLRNSRSAANSFFSQISQRGPAASAAMSSIERENLEKSKEFFLKNLADIELAGNNRLERARCLHNLAHIELRLEEKPAAESRFHEARELFDKVLRERSGEVSVAADTEARLADCFEQLAGLVPRSPSREMLAALEGASEYLNRLRARHPEDRQIAMRAATHDMQLGRQCHAHRHFHQAIEAYSRSAENLGRLREAMPESRVLLDMLSQMQFEAGLSLVEVDRRGDAADAHIAAIESIEQLAGEAEYSQELKLRLARSLTELGDLFFGNADGPETKDLYSESMRLLTPMTDDETAPIEAVKYLSRSMSRMAELVNEESQWTDAYRLSAAAIQKLDGSLVLDPDDLDASLILAEIRVHHAELLKYQRAAAQACLERGIDVAEKVRETIEAEGNLIDPERQTCRIRLAKIYQGYGDLCKFLGDTEKAETCFDRASRARELLAQLGEQPAPAKDSF